MADNQPGMALIMFNNDLDKALAGFILAISAASSGMQVNMFFTFWGLSILRKDNFKAARKPLLEKLFTFLLPAGTKKLKISKMNMGGMGTAMIKYVMRKKNIDALPQLVDKAREVGVKFTACALSMEIMGITKEELLDGIEQVNAASYLEIARRAQLNFFI